MAHSIRLEEKGCFSTWLSSARVSGGSLLFSIAASVCLLIFGASGVSAQYARPDAQKPPALRDIGIDQRLNEQVPLDLTFQDESGKKVKLGDYFGAKPVLLTLVYYQCPSMCNVVLNELTNTLKFIPYTPGKDFEIVTVSFDPRDTSGIAATKKKSYVERYHRLGAEAGWHFLTGDDQNIEALTKAVGFHYKFDQANDQFIHASGIMILTPQGKLARYFYGVQFPVNDVRLGLVEASQNKIGNAVDAILLFCYHYDPVQGKYTPIVTKIYQAGGIVTVLGLVGLIAFLLWLPTRRRNKNLRIERDRRPTIKPAHLAFAPLALLPLGLQLPFAPEQASTFAAQIDLLYLFLVVVTVVITVGIAVLEIFFAIKYRRRDPNEFPRPIAGSMKLELTWTIVPFLVMMVMFFWGAQLFFTMYRPPKDALEITATAKQWMWKFQHPDGPREINELHLPLGQRVKITFASEDVIHSFFVPAFRIKSDVVPGRYTTAWFETTKVGRYHLFCSEYCGTNHSGMTGWVEVMEPQDYQSWLAGGGAIQGASMVEEGQKLFVNQGCVTCHTGQPGARCPNLNGLYGTPVKLESGQTVTADDNYVRESIVNPNAKIVSGYLPNVMPTFQNILNEEQISQLLAYIKSIGPQAGGAPPANGGAQPTAPAATAPAPSATVTSTSGPNKAYGSGSFLNLGAENPDAQRSNPIGATAPSAYSQRDTPSSPDSQRSNPIGATSPSHVKK